MPNYNDGSWYRWSGERMKPASVHKDSLVEHLYHDESINTSGKVRKLAGAVEWGLTLKFRVIREHREPREFWISLNNGGIFNSPQENAIHVREVIEE